MSVDINTVLRTHFVQALVRRVCGEDIDIIKRPASFAIRRRIEDERDVERIIILPPRGYSADAANQTNSHDEAERATLEIKGAVRPGRQGFSRLRDCLLFAAFHGRGAVSDLDKPYMVFDLGENRTPGLITSLHSAGEAPFPVVKNSGFGFYHNLINATDDWLVLHLRKRHRPMKAVDLEPHLSVLPEKEADALRRLYQAILRHGDGVFQKTPRLIEKISGMEPEHALPALGEMLYVRDTGRHEACTAFAIILKIGKTAPEQTTAFLQETLNAESVPRYYAFQLIEKIRRIHPEASASTLDAGKS